MSAARERVAGGAGSPPQARETTITASWEALAADRALLDRLPREELVRGRWSKADVCLVRSADGAAVLKDYGRKALPVRWAGRWQLRRESRALRRLAGLPGIPRCYGRPGRCSILVEYIAGRRLGACRGDAAEERRLIGELETLVQAMHRLGVAHNDLRCRENILVRGEDGRLHLIDFSGAAFLTPGSLGHRLLFPLFCLADEGAVLKWKAEFLPGELSPREERRRRRITLLRRFWIFNPKVRRRSRVVLPPRDPAEPGASGGR